MEHPRHHGLQADRSEARLCLAFRPRREEGDGQLAAGMVARRNLVLYRQPAGAAQQPVAGGADRPAAPQRCQGATGSPLRHSRLGGVARPSSLHPLFAAGGHRLPPALAADQKPLFSRLAGERAPQPDPATPRGAGHLAAPLLGTPDPG